MRQDKWQLPCNWWPIACGQGHYTSCSASLPSKGVSQPWCCETGLHYALWPDFLMGDISSLKCWRIGLCPLISGITQVLGERWEWWKEYLADFRCRSLCFVKDFKKLCVSDTTSLCLQGRNWQLKSSYKSWQTLLQKCPSTSVRDAKRCAKVWAR